MRRRTVVVATLAVGGLALLALGRTWVTASGLDAGPVAGAVSDVQVSGNDAAPVASAMAVVIVVAALSLTIARRIGRWVVGALLALAGGTVAATSLAVVLDPAAAVARQVSEATGTTAGASAYAQTPWPWAAVVAGVLALALGVVVLTVGRRWPVSRRYQAPAGPSGPAGAEADGSAGTVPGGGPGRDAQVESARLDEMDAWDSLSRGEDPTA